MPPGMRVLIVEGDHRLATSLRRALSDWGMSVHVAHDGEDGLAMALRDEYDVIVLDLALPMLSGDAVARRLRDQRIHTPILMLTVLDAIERADTGADDYLVKPFSQRDLVARIRALHRHQRPDRRHKLRAGGIVLDTAARAVRVGELTVELTGNEFSILEYLMLNRGRVLTRAQILDHVWRYDFDGGRSLVEVYVGRLRRKLTDAGAHDPLVTVRGAGYRFGAPD